MTCPALVVCIFLLNAGSIYGHMGCSTQAPSPAREALFQERLHEQDSRRTLLSTVIFVKFWIVIPDTSDGSCQLQFNSRDWPFADMQPLQDQLNVLNTAFSASPFNFEAVDSIAQKPIRCNTQWANAQAQTSDEFEMKTALRHGDYTTLNFYILSRYTIPCGPWEWFCTSSLGHATFPFEGSLEFDGVVVDVNVLPGGTSGERLGHVGTHEVGHWLGLYHTFQNGCDHPGDMVADTPAHQPNFRCSSPNPDTCSGGGVDPIHNYMSYTPDSCKHEFTAGQVLRMEDAWTSSRDRCVCESDSNFLDMDGRSCLEIEFLADTEAYCDEFGGRQNSQCESANERCCVCGGGMGKVCPPSSPNTGTCSDNVQNQGEEGVDCGGPCQSCRSVSCGGHRASSCCGCPQGHGASWCNGECVWSNGVCELSVGSSVSCGAHRASTCSACPSGHGAAWCNGDCVWSAGGCRPAGSESVSCGGHRAATCSECPQGNGAAWCNGDCVWSAGGCRPAGSESVSCGGHRAATCRECPQGNGAAWCNGECSWSAALRSCVPT